MIGKYSYTPTFLIRTTSELRESNRERGVQRSRKPFTIPTSSFEEIRAKFYRYVEANAYDEALSWLSRLSRPNRIAIPLLFDTSLSDDWKWTLSSSIRKWGEKDSRLLRPTATVMYQTGEVRFLWQVVQHIYSNSKVLLSEESKKLWDSFTSSQDPYQFVANKLKHSQSAESIYEPLFIHRDSIFGERVFAELFKTADQQFYVQHTEFFIKYFGKAAIEEKRQLADRMIETCNLNAVPKISAFVLEEMDIYTVRPLLWEGVSLSSKQKFKNWHLLKVIEGNGERSDYWRKYINHFENILSKHKVWIMFSSDIVIIEVLRGGNALYVYDRGVFESQILPKLDFYFNKYNLNSSLEGRYLGVLKNRSLAIEWLAHNGDWQRRFDYWLMNNYDWEMRV